MEEKAAPLVDKKLHHRTLVWWLDVRRKLNDERRRRCCLLLLRCDIGLPVAGTIGSSGADSSLLLVNG
ncbi:hypothetical protein Peur_021502 [Populus x canadensis]